MNKLTVSGGKAMRTIAEYAEDIKSILNNVERTEHYDGETSVDIDELVNEILSINGTKDEPQEPIRNDNVLAQNAEHTMILFANGEIPFFLILCTVGIVDRHYRYIIN